MRQFRHLNKSEITEIIALHTQGETQAEIARRFNVDHSTINYHVGKYERAYPEQDGIYALIKVTTRKVCIHPSSKCTLCGEMMDQLLRSERDTIDRLTRKLAEAHSTLRTAGYDVE